MAGLIYTTRNTGRAAFNPTAEPSYNAGAGDVAFLTDSFDSYTQTTDFATARSRLNAGPWTATAGQLTLVAGRGGGTCVRCLWDGTDNRPLLEAEFTETAEYVATFWFRTSLNADPTFGDGSGNGPNGSGFKWWLPQRSGAGRQTWGISNLDQNAVNGWSSKSLPLAFTTHDNTSPTTGAGVAMPNPLIQNVADSPRFGTCTDNQWHRFTVRAKTGDTGYEMIWVDGTLVMDTRVAVTGIQMQRSSIGFSLLQFPGETVSAPSGGYSFWIEYDDFRMWTPGSSLT